MRKLVSKRDCGSLITHTIVLKIVTGEYNPQSEYNQKNFSGLHQDWSTLIREVKIKKHSISLYGSLYLIFLLIIIIFIKFKIACLNFICTTLNVAVTIEFTVYKTFTRHLYSKEVKICY